MWCSPAVFLFFRTNTFLELWTSFRRFQDLLKSKKARNVNEPGYPKYEPVMFDMDLFGGKKVPRTKYQESGAPSGLHGGPFPKIMFYVMIKVMRAAAHGVDLRKSYPCQTHVL